MSSDIGHVLDYFFKISSIYITPAGCFLIKNHETNKLY